MRISGPHKYVRIFLSDISANGGTVKGFIERYKSSKMMQALINSLYPNITIHI